MAQYFLVKEHNYEQIDSSFMGQDRSLLPGSYDSFKDAANKAKKITQGKDDVIYVVEMVGKCFGGLKQE